jgi:hypothetical protein
MPARPNVPLQKPIAAADSDPSKEAFHAVAVRPHELEEFTGVEVGRVFAEECFEPPLDIWRLPRTQAVALGNDPVVAEGVEHTQDQRPTGSQSPKPAGLRGAPRRSPRRNASAPNIRSEECRKKGNSQDGTSGRAPSKYVTLDAMMITSRSHRSQPTPNRSGGIRGQKSEIPAG